MRNFLSIFFINFKNIIRTKKCYYPIFVVFMFSVMLAVLVIQNIIPNMIDSRLHNITDNSFIVEIKDYTDVYTKFLCFVEEYKQDISLIKTNSLNDDSCYAYVYSSDNFHSSVGRSFTQEEMLNGEKVVLSSEAPVGSVVNIIDQQFKVIGNYGVNTYVVPFNSIDTDFIQYVEISLNTFKNKSYITQMSERLTEIIPCNISVEPDVFNIKAVAMIVLILILFVGVFNFGYFYRFILETRIEQFKSYYSLGFTYKQIRNYLISELLLFIVFSFMVATGMYFPVIAIGVNVGNKYFANNLSIIEFIYTFLTCLSIYLLLFCKIIDKFLKKSELNPLNK